MLTETRFGPGYDVIAELGFGGTSRVYKARQKDLGRQVAIKLAQQFTTDNSLSRFQQEALALSNLHHSGIVSVYGYGLSTDGFPYLVLEFVEGRTLHDEIHGSGRLPPERAISIVRQVCEALAYIHRQGIIHRDLKPDNIMLTTDNQTEVAKLIDLGFAKILPESGLKVQTLTQTGTAIGNILYMSPEECLGRAADARSDIYSLGAILYCCLVGAPPFASGDSSQVFMDHLHRDVPKLPHNIGSIPGLQNVIAKAMAKDRDDRYQNMEELARDLAILASGRGQSITQVTSPAVPRSVICGRGSVTGSTRNLILVVGVLVVSMSLFFAFARRSSDLCKQAQNLWHTGVPVLKDCAATVLLEAIDKNKSDAALDWGTVDVNLVQSLLCRQLDRGATLPPELVSGWVDLAIKDDASTSSELRAVCPKLGLERKLQVAQHIHNARAWEYILDGMSNSKHTGIPAKKIQSNPDSGSWMNNPDFDYVTTVTLIPPTQIDFRLAEKIERRLSFARNDMPAVQADIHLAELLLSTGQQKLARRCIQRALERQKTVTASGQISNTFIMDQITNLLKSAHGQL